MLPLSILTCHSGSKTTPIRVNWLVPFLLSMAEPHFIKMFFIIFLKSRDVLLYLLPLVQCAHCQRHDNQESGQHFNFFEKNLWHIKILLENSGGQMNMVCTKISPGQIRWSIRINTPLIVLTFNQTVLFFFISVYEVSSQIPHHSIF